MERTSLPTHDPRRGQAMSDYRRIAAPDRTAKLLDCRFTPPNGQAPAPGNGRPAGANGHAAGPPLAAVLTAAPSPPPDPSPDQPADGRDPHTGRFAAGNRLARGNPNARRMAALRLAFAE